MIDSALGTGPQQLEGPRTNSGTASPYPFDIYQTPLIDIAKTVSNIELVPARVGFYPVLFHMAIVAEKIVGTQTSPPTIRAGNNATHDNYVATDANDPTNAAVNASVAPALVGVLNLVSNTMKQATNAPVLFDITVPAAGTGGYSCMVKFVTTVTWISTDLF
jgi:hypothetical protein